MKPDGDIPFLVPSILDSQRENLCEKMRGNVSHQYMQLEEIASVGLLRVLYAEAAIAATLVLLARRWPSCSYKSASS